MVDKFDDPKKRVYLVQIKCEAQSIATQAYAAYWSASNRDYLEERMHEDFANLAGHMGYKIERKEQ